MSLYNILFARGGFASLIALAGGCGAVLVLSMPWAGKVADFFRFPWRPTPMAVLVSMALFTAIHALNRGGAVELLPHVERRRLLSLPLQVLSAQLLIVPYVVACIILTPASRAAILWLAWGYLATSNLALSLAAFLVSRSSMQRRYATFLPLAGLGAAVFGLPLAIGLSAAPLRALAVLSPPYAVYAMVTPGLTNALLLLAFGVPGVTALVLFLIALRQSARSMHAQLR